MRKLIALLMTLCTSYSFASENYVMFEGGYRHDTLSWSVRAPSDDPLFKISSDFEDVDILQFGVKARGTLGCNFYVRGSFDWGFILDGTMKNKTRLFAFGNESGDGPIINESLLLETATELNDRFVIDADLAIGYPFYFCDCQASLAPVVGYAFDKQYLEGDRNHRFCLDTCDSEAFVDFVPLYNNTKFISKWYGPFIGLDFRYDPCTCWDTYASFEYHWVGQKTKHYSASGFDGFDDWNHHYNNARGFLFNIGLNYDWDHCWSIGLDFTYRDFVAHRNHRFDNSGFDGSGFFDSSSDDFDFDSSSSSSGGCCNDRFKSNTKWRSYFLGISITKKF